MTRVMQIIEEGHRHASLAMYEILETEFAVKPEINDLMELREVVRQPHGWCATFYNSHYPDHHVVVTRVRDMVYTEVFRRITRFSKLEPASKN